MSKKRGKRTSQKRKRQAHKRPGGVFPGLIRQSQIQEASQWPLLEVLISETWQETTQICQIAVVRKSPDSVQIAVAAFLVDLGCLGIKNALTNSYTSMSVYQREYRQHLMASQAVVPGDLDLAAKIIHESIAYSGSLGFKPHKDTKMALRLLADAQPEHCHETIPLGKDGKPFFINGPYDDVTRILRVLNRHVGEGNYDFLLGTGDPME